MKEHIVRSATLPDQVIFIKDKNGVWIKQGKWALATFLGREPGKIEEWYYQFSRPFRSVYRSARRVEKN